MKFRALGHTGRQASEISVGAWAIGGDWGSADDKTSLEALHRAIDLGVNLIDTADVYGDGRSERLVGRLRRQRPETIFLATKAGRRLDLHKADGYNRRNRRRFVERSLKNLGVECLDLLHLHCPPTEVYYRPEVFAELDEVVQQGKIRYYGVSVEKVEEALKAIEYPNVQTVQIIFHIFRQRPADLFFELAQRRQVGILARVPLASGLLTGKMKASTKFETNDHLAFNRRGEEFDRGATFAGVDYKSGLRVAEELHALAQLASPATAPAMTMTQFALLSILIFDAVSCAIPGARSAVQVEENVRAANLPGLSEKTMHKVDELCKKRVRDSVHHYW